MGRPARISAPAPGNEREASVMRHVLDQAATANGRPPVLLYDYNAAAGMLSMTRGALRDLVYKGRGPVVTKIGNRTFFALWDLITFIEQHRDTA